MKKLYALLTACFLALPTFALEGTGQFVAYEESDLSTPEINTLLDVYFDESSNELTIADFAEIKDLTFSIDLSRGIAISEKDVVAKTFPQTMYFAHENSDGTFSYWITGTLKNTGEGKCLFSIPSWCLAISSTAPANGREYLNTTIELSFEISGLTDEPQDPDGNDNPEENDPNNPQDPDTDKNYNGVATCLVLQREGQYSHQYHEVPFEYNVTGTYENGKLSVYNFGNTDKTLPFSINLETGEVISDKGVFAGNITFTWEDGDTMSENEYYFSDLENNLVVTGRAFTNKEGKCVMQLDTWGFSTHLFGDLYAIQEGTDQINTIIVFNFGIDGLVEGSSEANVNSIETSATPRYFNLSGQEVTNPTSGSIVIKVQDKKVSKLIVR